MNKKEKLKYKLETLQSIISRMANNSSNCKFWCVTLLSAIIVFYFTEEINNINQNALLLPIIPFWLLDTYYLGFERYFVDQFNKTLSGINKKIIISTNRNLDGNICTMLSSRISFILNYYVKSFFSFSIWGFYPLIVIIVYCVIHTSSTSPSPFRPGSVAFRETSKIYVNYGIYAN
ncbi:MAG: hypothetical protein LBK68_07680 [Candidatus Margulisbacteria bacterium]|jgi:hypothetical protein|nr:hypothetical protein [Candidatus Margulisiibacteriota bacterium]